jgi:hypothetical protein
MRVIYLFLILVYCIGCTSKVDIDSLNYKTTIKHLNAQGLSLEEKETLVNDLNFAKSTFPYYQDFDTLAYLEKLNLQTEVNLISDTSTQKLDTLTLQFMAYACFCPQWVLIDSIPKNRPDLDGFYLNPATTGIRLPTFFIAGTTVTFIGRIEDNRHLNSSENSDDPIPGKELYYYYYNVHKPYSFWGEQVFESYDIHIIEDIIIGNYSSRVITSELL